MHQKARNSGFTLIEVSLAIVIGLVVLGGAVALYQQARTSAQNAAAKEKLLAVSALIAELDARNFGLPSLLQLRAALKLKRPDDYNVSPWGGVIPQGTPDDYVDGNDVVGLAAEIGNSVNGTPLAGTSQTDRGRLYYFRRDPAVAGRPYLWLDELNAYAPEATESVFRVTGFGLAYLGPQGQQWYFVEGNEKTNADGGPLAAEGEVGD